MLHEEGKGQVILGLSAKEVEANRIAFGPNVLPSRRGGFWTVFLRQLHNPLLLILAVTVVASYYFDDKINAGVIFGIMSVGIILGTVNEYSSEKMVSSLLNHITLSALVMRDGEKQEISVKDVVVGDYILLHQGTVLPADVRIVEAHNLSTDESSLTGESLPVSKRAGKASLKSTGYMGTAVVSGYGAGIVEAVGVKTEFGKIAHTVTAIHTVTAFQKGLAKLGALMTRVIVVMAVLIGVLNIVLGRDPLQAVLFALAIAIGLTPALLPVLVTVSMAQGAHRMAKKNVVVKQLTSIEDLGNMDVLCTDKTGTLTEGKINLVQFLNMRGNSDPYILDIATICNTATVHHKAVGNPIDTAIWSYRQEHGLVTPKEYVKLAEEEFNYDFRGQYTVIERGTEHLLLYKGAPAETIERCTQYRDASGHLVPIAAHRRALKEQFERLNATGYRLVAVAQRPVELQNAYSFAMAKEMELLGYITFQDVPKASAQHAINNLSRLGVEVKIITGDNEIVTQNICRTIGFTISGITTGPAIARMTNDELEAEVLKNNIFARISPDQKAQIVSALRRAGKVVGYMGDGVNDASALHAADLSISVNTAVDVAKDVASVVLLRKGLDVIADGVQEGRRIFANTIKYILMSTSSNFGNMFSMAGASLFLPFLPMIPSQILLNNSLYDSSQLALPGDSVDEEVLTRPHHWDIRLIYRYMLFFGPLSSAFDFLTFAILLEVFKVGDSAFQTGWFIMSIATQILVVFIIRTSRKPFWKSRPSSQLIGTSALMVLTAAGIAYSPLAPYLHMVHLPWNILLSMAGIVLLYLAAVEFVKHKFLHSATV